MISEISYAIFQKSRNVRDFERSGPVRSLVKAPADLRDTTSDLEIRSWD
jgi:hypothetical protein